MDVLTERERVCCAAAARLMRQSEVLLLCIFIYLFFFLQRWCAGLDRLNGVLYQLTAPKVVMLLNRHYGALFCFCFFLSLAKMV